MEFNVTDSNNLILSVSETMLVLMKSTGNYVHSRIAAESGKEAYKASLDECIKIVGSGLLSLDMIKSQVEAHRAEAVHLYKTSLFNKRLEEYRCHEMAVDNALDIIRSLEGRFITGQSDTDPKFFRGKGTIYEDKSVFR